MRFHPKYLVPNGVTIASMLLGLASVASSSAGAFELAGWMILWGVLLDNLDGASARLLNASSAIGAQLDSFADFVTFGVAPAALFYFRLRDVAAWSGSPHTLLLILCGLYVVATAVRLARFNVTPPGAGDRYFAGLTTTINGAVFASFYLSWVSQGWAMELLVAAPFLLLVGALSMVSNLPFPKLRKRKSRILNILQLVNGVAIYIVGPLTLVPEYILLIALLYPAVGVAYCVIKRIDPNELPHPAAD